jgi:hypothetical protein
MLVGFVEKKKNKGKKGLSKAWFCCWFCQLVFLVCFVCWETMQFHQT